MIPAPRCVFTLKLRSGPWVLGRRTLIMGIVNVTPDSFSDGGRYAARDVAVAHALRLVESGADILDIGGESTRPFSDPVPVSEELERVLPVIEELRPRTSVPISIDTTKAEVARRALDAGADIINDVSALRFDPDMAPLAAESGVPLILMHMLGTPKTMQEKPRYDALWAQVVAFLEERISEAVRHGVDRNQIIVDPGIGFGKTVEHNLRLVREHDAHVGIAFDGDADRVILADEKGEILDGDQLMAICAQHLQKQGRLPKNTVVATVMSNMGLEVALRSMGIRLVRTAVGDRYVVEKMLEDDFGLGGEQSGHIVFLEHSTTGDGILSALQILSVMLESGKPLSELKNIMERFPQTLKNVRVAQKKNIEEIPEIAAHVKKVEKELGKEGRLLIRPSGTEPVIRVMIEGRDETQIETLAEEMVEVIRKHFETE